MNAAINSRRTASESGARVFRPHARIQNRRLAANASEDKSPAAQTLPESKPRKPDSSALNETIHLAQQGDVSAFETLYQLHSRRVYSLCLRMLNDPVEAEDLTQEAFLQLFRKIHTFRGESAFSSWMYRLTANIVLMRFRKKRPVPVSLEEMTRPDDEKDRPAFEIGVPDLRLSGLFD